MITRKACALFWKNASRNLKAVSLGERCEKPDISHNAHQEFPEFIMEFSQIIYAKEGHVATITMNRPEKLNAYSEVMVHEMLKAFADARDDEQIRAIILTGAGRGFCSGGDISTDFQYPARYRGHRME